MSNLFFPKLSQSLESTFFGSRTDKVFTVDLPTKNNRSGNLTFDKTALHLRKSYHPIPPICSAK
jgi:hypothetical protein